ncbi:MAG: HAMP domain-containing protein [Spirochaetaceae bacterium]|nr:MAG: HAMP domain-containing protein [Spirochaetaceae bacterium]
MNVRTKIVAVVIPLLIGSLAVSGLSAFFVATNAVSTVTTEFLDFKTDQLEQYIDGQWRILVDNDLDGRADILLAAQAGIEVYARTMLRSESELIFAIDTHGSVAMATSPLELSPQESAVLAGLPPTPFRDVVTIDIDGDQRIASRFDYVPFGWRVFVSESRAAFYRNLNQITWRTLIVTAVSGLLTALVLFFVVSKLTSPVTQVVGAMRSIIASSDLGSRVQVHFRDEIGEMSQTFNVMVSELDKAYGRIKRYAFEAVLSQKRERKIRNIFQKYVPQELIDRFFENPESMLVGENRELAVLFSDIRSFTTISEQMQPDVLVSSLNRYFSVMVELIMERGGVIDKYIGDAIMAFFGAPVGRENDAHAALEAGMAMVEAVQLFNREQANLNLPEFHIGVGINYGLVTVGNIGTERKMDYTVIGDMVNVASRLEGLTKPYQQPLIISELLRQKVGAHVPTRIVDAVAVKGRGEGLRIHTAQRNLSDNGNRAWEAHNRAMEDYFCRGFADATRGFRRVLELLPGDHLAQMMIERCERYALNPPDEDWDGVEVMTSK